MRKSLALVSLLSVAVCSGTARAETYYVDENGSDDATGLAGDPWATTQKAADTVAPGDTVIVQPGNYAGFYLETSGTADAPITFSAMPAVIIDQANPTTEDGINLEGASFVIVEGFHVVGTNHAGIRAVLCDHVTIRNNISEQNFSWGILTGFCDNLLIENNETFGSIDEHGIYVSNSGDSPTIRHNLIHDNNANGIHMNGDAEQDGDGIISNALVEGNIIFNNGANGGSGINCDGVQDSRFVNNLIYESHASGISLYRIDGGGPSTNNLVVNNTVVVADDGRWALNIQNGSSGNTALNNILLNDNPAHGSIDISADSLAGFSSDYNVLVDLISNDETFISLAEWRTATGQDANSLVATAAEVFAAAGTDFHLLGTGPAVNAGTDTEAPLTDLDGVTRPVDGVFDIGAYEYCDGCAPTGTGGGPPTGGAGGATGTGGGSAGRASAGGASAGGASAGGASSGGSTSVAGSTSSGGSPNGTGGSAAGNAAADTEDDGGCGCRLGSAPTPSRWLLAFAGLLAFALRRRRG